MIKKILVSGALGAIAMLMWAFLANGIFGLKYRLDMKQPKDAGRVYEVLKGAVVEPGGYVLNPPLTPEGVFPPTEPVFSIRYSGLGHGAAGRMMLLGIAIWFASASIASWLLSIVGLGFRSHYVRRVLFFAAIGLLIVIFADLPGFGIAGYPLSSALLFCASGLISWILGGAVMAWWMRPDASEIAAV